MTHEPLAIISVACRLPGGIADPITLRDRLEAGFCALAPVPASRFDMVCLNERLAPRGLQLPNWGYFLDDRHVFDFDADFFGISPREAVYLDPQQRILLELAWEAVQRGGLSARRLAGSATGVFVGIANADYHRLQFRSVPSITAHSGTGTSLSLAANRISYFLDLRGPSLAIDTACSSSLVALHAAADALHSRAVDCALVGGVSLILDPTVFVSFGHAQMLAPDGVCKTFDDHADGFARGEGAGLLILKRLSDAIREGDRVIAVVRGSAVNQDGLSNGLTAPNGTAQTAVIRQALARAGVEPRDIACVEAHGTGTALGDPVEFKALQRALGNGRPSERYCLVGSAKTNFGHLEAAAGVLGIIKAALAVHARRIPPTLHLQTVNRHINVERACLRFPLRCEPWPDWDTAALAGVSAFGFGGTNAHAIVEGFASTRAIASPVVAPTAKPCVLPLCSGSGSALAALAAVCRTTLAAPEMDDAAVAEFCAATAQSRQNQDCRAVILARDREELDGALGALADGKIHPAVLQVVYASRTRPALALAIELSDKRRAAVVECLGRLHQAGAAAPITDVRQGDPAELLAELLRSWNANLGQSPVDVTSHVRLILRESPNGLVLQAILPTGLEMAAAVDDSSASTLPITLLSVLFLAGVDVDWRVLRPRGQGHLPILGVPTEPFNRRRLMVELPPLSAWFDGALPNPAPKPSAVPYASASAPTANAPLYEQIWEEATPSSPKDLQAALSLLILGPDADFDLCRAAWRDVGCTAPLMVVAGERLDLTDLRHASVRVDREDDVRQLLSLAAEIAGQRPLWISDLRRVQWAPGGAAESRSLASRCADLLDDEARAGEHLVTLLRAATAVQLPVASRIDILVAGTLRIGDSPSQSVRGAGLRGVALVAALELPSVVRAVVDLPAPPTRRDLAAYVRGGRLVRDEALVAVRGGKLLTPTLRPGRDLGPTAAQIRPDAWYLVTGAFGSLGIEVVQALCELGARQVVLVGRSGAQSGASREMLARLHTSGVSVCERRVDVGDSHAFAGLLQDLEAEGRAVRGIVHCAGTVGAPMPVLRLEKEELRGVLGAKVMPVLVVSDAARTGSPLDFFFAFSSIASVWGSRSLSAYVAANAMLDAAVNLSAPGCGYGVSVNWGPWAETGMGASEALGSALTHLGIRHLDRTEGQRLLQLLLSHLPANRVAVRADWTRLAQAFGAVGRAGMFREVGALGVASPRPEPRAGSAGSNGEGGPIGPTGSRRDRYLSAEEIGSAITEELRSVLGQDTEAEISPSAGFLDLGLDSILAVELKDRLDQRFGVELPATIVFEQPTITALATSLARLLGAGQPTTITNLASVTVPKVSKGEISHKVMSILAELDDPV